jgi:isoquinoline 1-oxidoreductase beta subunit
MKDFPNNHTKLVSAISGAINKPLARREFLKLSAVSGGGLLIATVAPSLMAAEESPSLVGSAELNAYVQVRDDGKIIIYSGTPDMGQGIKTSLPMIVAEEMGADWDDVIVMQAPGIDEKYGIQSTGGSYTLYRNFDFMRQMGAMARDMFLNAGAIAMELPKQELKAEDSIVSHPSGESRTFLELVGLAYKQAMPAVADLIYKGREEYKIIGTSKSQVDSREIVTGVGDFGIDTRVPGMLYGAYEKSPSVGGRIISANIAEIKRLPGVVDAYVVKGNGNVRELMDGVGIVGTSTWAVFKAKQKINAVWDESDASTDSWKGFSEFAAGVENSVGSDVVVTRGAVDEAFSNPDNTILDGFFEYPYVTHLCLEPMNCTADFRPGTGGGKDHLEVWLPTQNGPRFQGVAEKNYGLAKDQVTINIKRMGGSFGRRVSNEYACEAIELSQRCGKPVKLTWSREDSIKHDFFRVGGFEKIRAAVNPAGQVVGWDEHAIGVQQDGKRVIGSGFRDSAFPLSNMPVVRGTQTLTEMKTLCGPWRAPWSNTHAFISQCFVHEIATATNRDHAELLLEMLGESRWLEEGNVSAMNTGRAADVIKLVTEKAGWGRSMPEGRGLGLSFYFCHAAHVAEIAEVSVDKNKKLTLHKVTTAVDVGPIVNMSGAMNQVQGAIMDGYSTMIGQKITMENGRIEQSNLHEYPVLRIDAAPEIDVHFIQSDNKPTGLGEPALPPLAPAVANAIFAATGERVRSMPLSELGFTV